MTEKIKLWKPRWQRGLHGRWFDHSPEGWHYELVPFNGGWLVFRGCTQVRSAGSLQNAKFGAELDWQDQNGIVSYPRVLGGGKKPERVAAPEIPENDA